MTKKKDKKSEPEEKEDFNLAEALSTVNRYLIPGFSEYIKDEEIKSQKQFDKLYNDYKEFR